MRTGTAGPALLDSRVIDWQRSEHVPCQVGAPAGHAHGTNVVVVVVVVVVRVVVVVVMGVVKVIILVVVATLGVVA